MEIGGVLAMGCTISQGLSTLAINEANFGKALITGLVDMRLLPESWCKLEKV